MPDYKILPDFELLQLLKSDDNLAFKTLYHKYWQNVYGQAFQKTRSDDTAQEITQAIFVSIWNNRLNLQIENFPAYLNRSVRNSIISYLRSLLVREAYARSVRSSSSLSIADSDRLLLWKDLLSSIEDVLQILPAKTQEVFRLSRFEQKSVKEIAGILNLSEKAVEYHITQSLKLLRVHLNDAVIIGIVCTSF